jgi:hypothetical protein
VRNYIFTLSKLILAEGSSRLENGFIKIHGEVKNTSSGWARSVRIAVTLFDASGKKITEDHVYASIELVAPGPLPPLYLQDVNHVTGTYTSHKLDVSAILAPPGATPKLENVTSKLDEFGFYDILGKYVNAGSTVCHNPQVVVAGYSSDGKVYEVEGMFGKSLYQA